MDTVKELFRTKSFWVFIGVAILGGIEAIYAIPLLGLLIAAITIFGISLQGVETVLTEKNYDSKLDLNWTFSSHGKEGHHPRCASRLALL